MIVYDLVCRQGEHRFEGWFRSSDDFAAQQAGGLLMCPHCGMDDVVKAVQAANVGRKGNQTVSREPVIPAAVPAQVPGPASAPAAAPVAKAPLPPQAVELMHKLARIQAEALQSSRYVGGSFADDARAMHYGEREAEAIHGKATLAEAQELAEEGIGVMPLLFPVASPDEAN